MENNMGELNSLDAAIAEGLIALSHFEATGDRNKFIEWEQQWGSLIRIIVEDKGYRKKAI